MPGVADKFRQSAQGRLLGQLQSPGGTVADSQAKPTLQPRDFEAIPCSTLPSSSG